MANENINPKVTIKPYDGIWKRNDVAADKNNLYLFTDNTDRDSGRNIIPHDSKYYQKHGDGEHDLHFPFVTSALIRGLDNAMPVSTQHWYHQGAKGDAGRWNDSDAVEFTQVVGKEFSEIRRAIIDASLTQEGPFTVFLPAGGDGFTNGKISAITEDRTPKLFAYLKTQEAGLQFTAELINAVIAGIEPTNERVKEVAESIRRNVSKRRGAPSDTLLKYCEDEAKMLLLRAMPVISTDTQQETQTNTQNEGKDLSALSSYTPYQLKMILDDVEFPARGEDKVFDDAADYINLKLSKGWNKELDTAHEKAFLLAVINELPEQVSDVVIQYAKINMPLKEEQISIDNSVFDENPCDAYTLGFSTKSLDEFTSALPPSASIIIDIRQKPNNRFRPWFNPVELEKSLSDKGINYVYISEGEPDFIQRIQQLIVDNPNGAVICSSESKPEKSSRGLDLGPRLERSGIKVGHITQGFNAEDKHWTAKIRIESQEELTSRLLGNKEIRNGSFRQVRFTPEGKPILDEEVTLIDKITHVVEDRNIIGHDNYHNPVEVAETKKPGLGEALFEAAKQSNFTLVFKSGHPSPQEKLAMDAAAGSVATINVPDDDDRLRDPVFAREVVYGANGRGGLMDTLNRAIFKQALQYPDTFNKNDLTLQVEGINEARLLNKPAIDGHVSEEELSKAGLTEEFNKIGGIDEGFSIVRPAHASLPAFRDFVKNIINVINEPKTKNILGDEQVTDESFSFSKIVSTGDSGAGEAALLAAQESGLAAKAQAPMGFQFTIDNGTLQGHKVKDAASYANRFKLGLKKGLSEDDLRLQIDHVHAAGQNISGPGLTDRQVLVLSQLGFSNSDILAIYQQSVINNIKIEEVPVKIDRDKYIMSGSEALLNLIQLTEEGYGAASEEKGLIVSELSTEKIIAAEETVDKLLVSYRRNNIGVVTIANKYYPDQLRSFNGYSKEAEIFNYSIEGGSARAEKSIKTITYERPAILTYRGNIEALLLDKVTVTGNSNAKLYERNTAKRVGEEIGKEGLAVVTAFKQKLMRGHTSYISSESVLGLDYDNVRSHPGKDLFRIFDAANDSPSVTARSAAEYGSAQISVSPNGLYNKSDQDRINSIVAGGGVVFSEADINAGEGNSESYERAGRIACALSDQTIVLASKPLLYAESPASEAKDAAKSIITVDYRDIPSDDKNIAGSINLIADGATTIQSNGRDLSEHLSAIHTRASEDDILASVEKELQETNNKSNTEKVEMHVDHYQFFVARKGTEQVFIVPENFPDVRQSIRSAYGEDAVFSDNLTLSMKTLKDSVVSVAGESVRSFTGYKGTQIMQEPVYYLPLFYDKGQIYSSVNAPRNTPGLIRSQRTRILNKKDFDSFRSLALNVQEKFLNEVYQGAFGAHKPIRFENAFYPIITQHSVEIFKGEQLMAKVFIDEKGNLKVRSFGNLTDDLTEYSYSKYIFPNDIDATKIRHSKGDSDTALEPIMYELAARMESLLLSVPLEETEMFALATREQREDIQQRLDNQFLKLSEDNLDVAATDYKHGIDAGYLAECDLGYINVNKASDGKVDEHMIDIPGWFSKEDAMAAVIGEQERVRKEIGQLMKADIKNDKKIQDAINKRDAAYNQGYSVQEYEKLDQDIDTLLTEKSNILSTLTSAKQRYAILQNTKEDIAMAEGIFKAKSEAIGGDKKLALYVDGASVEIIPSLITTKTKDLAKESIAKITETKISQEKYFMEGIESVENHHADLVSMGQIFDQRSNSSYGKAEKSEIKPESFSKGRYIIVRDGKEAYADEALNIRSEFYDTLKPWNGSFGTVQKDGKSNFVDPAGLPIVDTWFDSRSVTSNGTFVIEVDGEYGVVGEDGKCFGGRFFSNAHTSIDGWSAIQGGISEGENAGKYNFINAEGKLISKAWFDEVADFNEGKAIVKVAGKYNELDVNGKTIRKDIKIDLPQGQSLFNSGKGKGGRK